MLSKLTEWKFLDVNFKFDWIHLKDQLAEVPRWVWVTVCAVGAVTYSIIRHEQKFGVWRRQNVPGPKPWPMMGTNYLVAQYKTFHEINIDLSNKYGSKGYFGTYEGSLPVLVVTDPEIVREVMIKQFDVFPNRRTRTSPAIKYMRKMIVIMQHDEWRRTRSALSPTFTGAKLKKMVAVMNDVASNFSRKLSSLSCEEIENIQLKPIFRAYTMDVICNVVFGFKIDTQSDTENEVAQACFKMTEQNQKIMQKPLIILFFLFPGLIRLFQLINPTLGFNMDPATIVSQKLASILQQCTIFNEVEETTPNEVFLNSNTVNLENGKELEESGERSFFLGTLIEMIELHQRSNGIEGFDFETAVAQALIFIVGGFDTSSNLLMWVTYYLAVHPELQEEIRKEIECVLGSGNRVATYEDLTSMKFLDNFIMETLRLRPIFQTQRQAVRDTVIGPDIKIKAGWSVNVAPNVIHMDPRIWDRPEEFRPERFEPEEANKRSPYAFNSFGVGPRNCIGMRLALVQAKMAIIGLLTDYRLSLGKDTPVPITEFVKSQFFEPAEPIRLKLSKL